MRIPAMDSLRSERLGIIRDGNATAVVQTHVQVDTDERGVRKPLESMSRPFPYLTNVDGEARLPETLIENANVEPLSDTLIEYVALLQESMEEGDWVDELEEFDRDSFSDETDEHLARALREFTTRELPRTLYRTVYESASDLQEEEAVELLENPLRDIESQEVYDFSFLPSVEETDDFDMYRVFTEQESDDGTSCVYESLWLRYTSGETAEERPLITYQENGGFVVNSPDTGFGSEEMESVETQLVSAILDGDTRVSNLSRADIPENSRTRAFLEEYVERNDD